jgi:hypothetical protein
MVDGGLAACRPNQNTWLSRSVIMICSNTLIPITQMPANMGCLRNGCRQIFLAAIT